MINATAENIEPVPKSKPKRAAIGAINPCDLCTHGVYQSVDRRCGGCGLRGRRFFEVLHARKAT